MGTIEIGLMYQDDSGDLRCIATVRWPAVPRVGETIVLSGPEFGDGRSDEACDEQVFKVADVCWRYATDSGDAHEYDVQVLLDDPDPSIFRPLCTCSPGEVRFEVRDGEVDMDSCGYCGMRLGPRHRRVIAKRGAGEKPGPPGDPT